MAIGLMEGFAPDAETAPFWEAAKDERLLVKSCDGCGKAHWYPRSVCPFCSSPDTRWIEAGGGGQIYSYCVMSRADPVYTIAYVTLDEGPTMMTNIVDCAPETLSVGDRVHVKFVASTREYRLPVFAPTTGNTT